MNEVEYNEVFEEFFLSQTFYKVLWGTAGSGKSFATAQKIIKRCLEEEGHTVWCFRKVSTYISESVFAELLKAIDAFGCNSLIRVNKTERKIHFSNGNRIICAGLDDEEKLKSIAAITIAWVEEATEFDEQDINQLSLRMRGQTHVYREMILSFNPISELHWIKKKFFDEPTPFIKENVFILHTTYEQNHFLDEQYKERLRHDHSHDKNNYRIYVEGKWGQITTGQEYYKNFNDDHIAETIYKPFLPLHLTFDFNTLPYMSASLWQIERVKDIYEVRGLKEYVMRHPKNSTEDTCYHILETDRNKLAQSKLILYGDASGKARKTSSKHTDYDIIDLILGHYILESRVPRSNPLSQDRHTFMNRMMFGTFPIKMIIHPQMKELIQDFRLVLEDAERKKHKKRARDPVSKQIVEKYGHFSDGADYLFMAAFKNILL